MSEESPGRIQRAVSVAAAILISEVLHRRTTIDEISPLRYILDVKKGRTAQNHCAAEGFDVF